ncbi:phosphoribosylaminoimidazolesuccinocarboxamide synthase [Marinihelvus fidelis]|uniref:Phosphoribosylaminoimidazole-succinocarboxamide synthase n=1 Tax=Marinihelvus fidelis TaxID=2613842 RepID=A0A5N0T997_9GAMM|nr:phosphoribosylaminoimidazolesuccinocarboxamide synthase [Marinihelvus fidelis]
MITDLPLLHQGKVRDCFAVGDDHMLMVASDRISAFDVILPDPIPGKGEMLTQLSNYWFGMTEDLVGNHLSDISIYDVFDDAGLAAQLEGRSMVVKKLDPLPLEAIVRGYIIGSGWKDYQKTGEVCGIPLPAGLQQADKLPEILFTPSTKAAIGEHDENVSFEHIVGLVGEEMANRVKDLSIALYKAAADHAEARGIIIADTKFEFGLDKDGTLCVMDEVLTPDSSRFWPADSYAPGSSPPSFDKQYVRDYLETLDWDKKAPGPRLPQEVINVTRDKYAEVGRRLTQD